MITKTKIIIGIFVFVILIAILIIYQKIDKVIYASPNYNATNQTDFCSDSDYNSSLIEQSKIKGFVFHMHNECNLGQINKPDSDGNFCAYSLTYNDYCINSTTLREKICKDNKVSSENIVCLNSCINGVCS